MAGDIPLNEQLLIVPATPSGVALAPLPEAALGVRTVHIYGARVRIAEGGPGEQAAAPLAAAAAAEAVLVEPLSPTEALGVSAFQLRMSPEYIAAKQDRPRQGEEWNLPEGGCGGAPAPLPAADAAFGLEAAAGAANGPTSSALLGTVAVGIILVGGPTADLQFSADERTKVIAEVQNGLSFYAATNPNANLTFVYDIHDVTINVPPNPNAPDTYEALESLWRDPAMARLGYPASFDGVWQYVQAIRQQYTTDWTYCAFFTKYPTHHFAYASLPRLVMQYSNDGWGPDNIDRVFAHESGHIFGCPDEYASSGCNCGGSWGPWGVPNRNCANCASGGGCACIMKQNDWAMCLATPAHLGWWRNPSGYIFSYKVDDGTAAIDGINPKVGGTLELWRAAWSTGWSIVKPFTTVDAADNRQVYLFEYKGGDGTAAIDCVSADGSGTAEMWRAGWSTGWTTVEPFTLANGGTPQVYLFEYKAGDGTAAIDSVNPGGNGTTEVWRGGWSTGWTNIKPFTLVDGGASQTYLFEYKGGDGTAAIDIVNPGGNGTTEVWRGAWSTGWTNIEPFVLDEGGIQQTYLLEYKAGDGTVAIDRINPGGSGTTEVWRSTWTTGWSSIRPAAIADGAAAPAVHFFAYKVGDGTIAVDRANPGGSGTTEVWRSTWTAGWTFVEPFAYA